MDILVVMPANDEINQAVRILEKTTSSFLLDLIVRTPHNLRWRLEEGDWFLREIIARGTVLYEKAHRGVDSQAESDFRVAKNLAGMRPHDKLSPCSVAPRFRGSVKRAATGDATAARRRQFFAAERTGSVTSRRTPLRGLAGALSCRLA